VTNQTDDRVSQLETRVRELDLAREKHETRWGVIATVVGSIGLVTLGLAGVTRDTGRDTAARVAVLEKAQSESVVLNRAAADEQRATHDAVLRLTITVDAMRVTLDALARPH
jgi:hypothetical protein